MGRGSGQRLRSARSRAVAAVSRAARSARERRCGRPRLDHSAVRSGYVVYCTHLELTHLSSSTEFVREAEGLRCYSRRVSRLQRVAEDVSCPRWTPSGSGILGGSRPTAPARSASCLLSSTRLVAYLLVLVLLLAAPASRSHQLCLSGRDSARRKGP